MQRVTGGGVVKRGGRTYDNIYLPKAFIEHVEAEYGGTRLGRQELDGELLEDAEGALWTRELIERCRVGSAPTLTRVVVGMGMTRRS